MTAPCLVAAEVQRLVKLELAVLYDLTLAKSLELSRKGDVHLAAAYRSAASSLFAAEQEVRSC